MQDGKNLALGIEPVCAAFDLGTHVSTGAALPFLLSFSSHHTHTHTNYYQGRIRCRSADSRHSCSFRLARPGRPNTQSLCRKSNKTPRSSGKTDLHFSILTKQQYACVFIYTIIYVSGLLICPLYCGRSSDLLHFVDPVHCVKRNT